MTTCPNCDGGGCPQCRAPFPPTAGEIMSAETIIRRAGGCVFWPVPPVGDCCNCEAKGEELGPQHDRRCPNYTPF